MLAASSYTKFGSKAALIKNNVSDALSDLNFPRGIEAKHGRNFKSDATVGRKRLPPRAPYIAALSRRQHRPRLQTPPRGGFPAGTCVQVEQFGRTDE
jgi:hypothetical protein